MGSRDAREVRIGSRQLRLVNLEKVFYPQAGFTKAQVIDYYVGISKVLLPHLRDRPLTLKRYPNGVDQPYFYEKRCPQHRPPWVRTADADGIRFCLVNDLASLVWVANLADLELHVPLARARSYTRPDQVVFDLDPGAPAGIVQCCAVGLLLRGLFESLGLRCYAKTSGSKGLQVYLPLNAPGVTYDDTKPFARAVETIALTAISARPKPSPEWDSRTCATQAPRLLRQGIAAPLPRRRTAKIRLMTARIRRMWIQAPIWAPDTRPRTQSTSRMTVIVQSMSRLLSAKSRGASSREEWSSGPSGGAGDGAAARPNA